MSGSNCLNCGHLVSGNYCGHCGQKAATHRFTLKHFIAHDIIHGAFHLDRGFPYTLKQLFTKPYSIREFIEGKRVGHFNAITFLLLIIALNLFVQAATDYDLQKLAPASEGSGLIGQLQYYQKKYIKELYLVTIPLASLFSYFVFKKSKLNFAEHLVLNTYKEGFVLLLNTLPILLLPLFHTLSTKLLIQGVFGLAANIWVIWYLHEIFRKDYNKKLTVILLLILFFIINTAVTTALGLTFIYFTIGFPE